MLRLSLFFAGWIACWVVLTIHWLPKESGAWRRLHVLWLLILPWGLAILGGPFVINHHVVSANAREWMTIGQYGALALFFVIAAACVVWARPAWKSALAVSLANLVPVFLLVAINVTIIDPGS